MVSPHIVLDISGDGSRNCTSKKSNNLGICKYYNSSKSCAIMQDLWGPSFLHYLTLSQALSLILICALSKCCCVTNLVLVQWSPCYCLVQSKECCLSRNTASSDVYPNVEYIIMTESKESQAKIKQVTPWPHFCEVRQAKWILDSKQLDPVATPHATLYFDFFHLYLILLVFTNWTQGYIVCVDTYVHLFIAWFQISNIYAQANPDQPLWKV